MNIELEIIQHRKENIGDTLLHIGLDNDFFFIFDTKNTSTKAKINRWDFLKLVSLYTAKKTVNKMKSQPTELGKVFLSHKELIFKI